MSAQEFKVGDVIGNDDYDRLPVGATVCLGLGFATFTKEADNLWRSDHGDEARDEIKRFNRNLISLPAEPEDKDDLYVEPEPLKEGDWCLVWAEVQGSEWSDDTTPVHLPVPDPDLIFVPRDAIVRPDAGQVPPWVRPAKSEAEELAEVIGCEHHDAEYGVCSVCVAAAERVIDAGWIKGGAS